LAITQLHSGIGTTYGQCWHRDPTRLDSVVVIKFADFRCDLEHNALVIQNCRSNLQAHTIFLELYGYFVFTRSYRNRKLSAHQERCTLARHADHAWLSQNGGKTIGTQGIKSSQHTTGIAANH